MAEPLSRIVRVRFAPSPTGLLHIGGLRTALYNYLFARHNDGRFILRIEDTDRERFVEEAEADILDALQWSGLSYDEGPGSGGPDAPYYQSERKELYQRYATQLLESGSAYYAFDSVDDLRRMREHSTGGSETVVKYDAVTRMQMTNSFTLPDEEVRRRLEEDEEHVVRLRMPRGEMLHFRDLIREDVTFESDTQDDQVLIKSDGMPTYHLANVIDDHLMGITHVIRGEEWLSSTPKHVFLYQAFGWEPPVFAHLPLLLSPSGGKLSKRNAETLGLPVTVSQYREAGYEPEALINWLAFLGWNPGTEKEIFSIEELSDVFSLERVGSHGVQLDIDKLKWYNEQYIRSFSTEELIRRARPYLDQAGIDADEAYLGRVAELMQERISLVKDLATECPYFFADPSAYEEQGVKKRWKTDAADLLTHYAQRLDALDLLTAESAEEMLRSIAAERDVGAGRIIHPARLAVSGLSFGPSLFHMMEVLGKQTCIRRIKQATAVLG